jgi:hypothetical protein
MWLRHAKNGSAISGRKLEYQPASFVVIETVRAVRTRTYDGVVEAGAAAGVEVAGR